MERHTELKLVGFTLDDTHPIAIYNHACGIWIARYALEQYSDDEWEDFMEEFFICLNKYRA